MTTTTDSRTSQAARDNHPVTADVGPKLPDDHSSHDTQGKFVVGDPCLLNGQNTRDDHVDSADEHPNSRTGHVTCDTHSTTADAGQNLPDDQTLTDSQVPNVVGDHYLLNGQIVNDAHADLAAEQFNSRTSHTRCNTQTSYLLSGQNADEAHNFLATEHLTTIVAGDLNGHAGDDTQNNLAAEQSHTNPLEPATPLPVPPIRPTPVPADPPAAATRPRSTPLHVDDVAAPTPLDPYFPDDHAAAGTQNGIVVGDLNSQTTLASAGSYLLGGDQPRCDTHAVPVAVEEPNSPCTSHRAGDLHAYTAGLLNPPDLATTPSTRIQATPVPVDPHLPDDQKLVDTHNDVVVGDLTASPPGPTTSPSTPATATPVPIEPFLADPFLALAADVLDDIETTRIANENRLRELTTPTPDKNGKLGYALTLDHPDVARVAAIVSGFLCHSKVLLDLGWDKQRRTKECCLEHEAIRNLEQKIKNHPLGPWMKSVKGLGFKQGARLLAAIGDPYIRPELIYKDRTEPARPRKISELNHYAGMHVVPADPAPSARHVPADTPTINASGTQLPGQVKGDTHFSSAGDPISVRHQACDPQRSAADGTQLLGGHSSVDHHGQDAAEDQTSTDTGALTSAVQSRFDLQTADDGGTIPSTSQSEVDNHVRHAGGDHAGGNPDHVSDDTQTSSVGVAAFRRKGQRITWSPTARSRIILIADKIVQVGAGGPYRAIYDQGRIKYANAVHRTECKRCGPAGKPAPAGSPLSKGHQDARGRRLVAKAILEDLWRESRRIHHEANGTTP